MKTFKNLMVAVSLILAAGIASTANAGMFDFFGPTADDKKEYQRQTMDMVREKVMTVHFENSRVLAYEYVDQENIRYANGIDAYLVSSMIKIDSSNYGQYFLMLVTVFKNVDDRLILAGYESNGLKSKDYSKEMQKLKLAETLKAAKDGLASNGFIFASAN